MFSSVYKTQVSCIRHVQTQADTSPRNPLVTQPESACKGLLPRLVTMARLLVALTRKSLQQTPACSTCNSTPSLKMISFQKRGTVFREILAVSATVCEIGEVCETTPKQDIVTKYTGKKWSEEKQTRYQGQSEDNMYLHICIYT